MPPAENQTTPSTSPPSKVSGNCTNKATVLIVKGDDGVGGVSTTLPTNIDNMLRRLMVTSASTTAPPTLPIQLKMGSTGGVEVDDPVVGVDGGPSSSSFVSVVLCCSSLPTVSRSDGWSLSMLPPTVALSVLRSPSTLDHIPANQLPLFIQLPDCRPCWNAKLLNRLQILTSRATSVSPLLVERQTLRREQQHEQIRLQSRGVLAVEEDDLIELQQEDDLELARPAVIRCTVPPPSGDRRAVLTAILSSVGGSGGSPSTSSPSSANATPGSRSPLSPLLSSIAPESSSSRVPIAWLVSEEVGSTASAPSLPTPISRLVSKLIWIGAFDGVNQLDFSYEKADDKCTQQDSMMEQLHVVTATINALRDTYLTTACPTTNAGDDSSTSCATIVSSAGVATISTPPTQEQPSLQILLRDVREVKLEGYVSNPSATSTGIKLIEALTRLLVGGVGGTSVVKSSLQHLSFSGSPLLDIGPLLGAIADVIKSSRKELTSLVVEGDAAEMEGLPVPPTSRSLRALLYPLCPLTSINLSGCRLPVTSLCYLLSQCPTLTHVTLDDPVRVPQPSRKPVGGAESFKVGVVDPKVEVYYSGEDPSEGVKLLRACRRYATHISMAGVGLMDTPEVAGALSELLLGIDYWTGVRGGDGYTSTHRRELQAASSLSHSPVHPDHTSKSGVVSLNLSRNGLGRHAAKAIGEALLDARNLAESSTSTTSIVRRFHVEDLDLRDNGAFGQESLLFLLKCMAGSSTLRSVKLSQKGSIEGRLEGGRRLSSPASKKKSKTNASPTKLPSSPTLADLNSRAAVIGTQELRALLEFFVYNCACQAPLHHFSFTTMDHEKRCVDSLAKGLLTSSFRGGVPIYGSLRSLDIDSVSLPHLTRCDSVEQCVASADCDFRDQTVFPNLAVLSEVVTLTGVNVAPVPVSGKLTDYHVLNQQLLLPASALLCKGSSGPDAVCVSMDDGLIEYTVECLSATERGVSLVPEVVTTLRTMAAQVLLASVPQHSTPSRVIVTAANATATTSPINDFCTMAGLFADLCVFTGSKGYTINTTGAKKQAVQPQVVFSKGKGPIANHNKLKHLLPCGPFADLSGVAPLGNVQPTSLVFTSPHGSYFNSEVLSAYYAVSAMPATKV